MRLRLLCAMAMILPTAMDSSARIASMACQSACCAGRPSASSRMAMAKAPIFGAEAINSVTGVEAPW